METNPRLTFSNYFGINKKTLDKEGLFNVSLISDLPLFIDPFHLFYSDDEEYQRLHEEIIKYLVFLREQSIENQGKEPTKGVIDAYYKFPEISQNWLGFTFLGNKGHGLGRKFALALNQNFFNLFRDFGIKTEARHFEKLALVAKKVGRDTISDFTTNLIVGFLAKKTEDFASKYIDPAKTQKFTIKKSSFDYSKKVWVPKTFMLPTCNGDYVLLTPKDLLTKNNTWINKKDFVDNFSEIPLATPDNALREQLSSYFNKKLDEYAERTIDRKTNKEVLSITEKTRTKASWATADAFPETIDIYIMWKERHGNEAQEKSWKLVTETESFLENQFNNFAKIVDINREKPNSYKEAYERAIYFKFCIEKKDVYINCYNDDGTPASEDWIQRMFWLCWYGTKSILNRDPNNGLGKPDFSASQGRGDNTLIEFKLAKSSSLESNLENQLKKYKETNEAKEGIWVIIFFTSAEHQKVLEILKEHNLENDKNYILVDARKDNKIPASKIK